MGHVQMVRFVLFQLEREFVLFYQSFSQSAIMDIDQLGELMSSVYSGSIVFLFQDLDQSDFPIMTRQTNEYKWSELAI